MENCGLPIPRFVHVQHTDIFFKCILLANVMVDGYLTCDSSGVNETISSGIH